MQDNRGFSSATEYLLGQSRRLSYIIVGITLATCMLFLWAAQTLDLPTYIIGAFATNSLFLVWGNRRAIVDIPRYRLALGDSRLKAIRSTVITMAAADAIAFAVSVATAIRLFSILLHRLSA